MLMLFVYKEINCYMLHLLNCLQVIYDVTAGAWEKKF